MARIDGLNRMLTLLRARMGSVARTRDADKAARGTPRERGASSGGAAGGARSLEALRGAMQTRMAELDREAPDFAGRAAGVFVECVLAWEFGDEVLGDPAFADVIAQVRDELTADAGLAESLEGVVDQLGGGR